MTDDVDTMLADIAAHYDNVETSTLQNPTTRTARYVSYMQRAAEELWYHRAWPFAMAVAPITMVAGAVALPTDFARVGPEGAVLDSRGMPWVEISFQDMAYLRTRRLQQAQHLFCIGPTLQVVNVASTETFTIIYQITAPEIATGATTGFPIPFSHALLLGTVMKLKEEEGDARDIWRRDYFSALAKATALWTQASRPQRMPKTVPGRMW